MDNLKQANRGCLLLFVSIVAALFTTLSGFFIFAMGMGGTKDIPFGTVVFFIVIIVFALSCLITPLSGLWGFALVAISTFKEISADRKSQESSEPYRLRSARVFQSVAIGIALTVFFNVATAGPIGSLDGDLAFASYLSGTALFPLVIFPTLIVLGSLGGGLGYARLRGRESATAAGAVIGGVVAALIALIGFIIYIMIR